MNSKQSEDAKTKMDYHVDYLLDMIAHELIKNGQLPASKSYIVKSPEMRAQMEKQLTHVNRRRDSKEKLPGDRKVTFKPTSTPIGFTAVVAPSGGATVSAVVQKYKKHSSNAKVQNNSNGATKASTRSRSLNPASVSNPPLKLTHSKTMQLSTHHHKKDSSKNTLKILKPVSIVSNNQINEAFWTRVDMKGFADDEIALDVDSRHVTVTGYRQRRGMQNSRKVTEVIEIPHHVKMETLRIGRRADGALIIEENIEN